MAVAYAAGELNPTRGEDALPRPLGLRLSRRVEGAYSPEPSIEGDV